MTQAAHAAAVRRIIIDWLDDNYHFGDAETVVGDDDRSFLQNGILDSLGFVKLTVYLEDTFHIKIDRKTLTPQNFDSMNLMVTYTINSPGFSLPA